MDKEKEKDTKKKAVAAAAKRPRVSIAEYFRGVRTEIKKVVWPTRKEMGSYSIVVFLACAFFSILFGVVDYGVLAALQVVLGINLG